MSEDLQQDPEFNGDRKGAVRIQTDLLLRVVGRDGEPVRRTGNICASGLFFEVEFKEPQRTKNIAGSDLVCIC